MTLENKYKEIMDHIQVDEAMRARILENLRNESAAGMMAGAKIESIDGSVNARQNARRRAMITRIMPAAAAAVALLIGGVILFGHINDKDTDKYSTDSKSERNVDHNDAVEAVSDEIGYSYDSITTVAEYEFAMETMAGIDSMIEAEDGDHHNDSFSVNPFSGTSSIGNTYTLLIYQVDAVSYTSIDELLIRYVATFAGTVEASEDTISSTPDIEYLFILSNEDDCDERVIGFADGAVMIDGVFYDFPASLTYGSELASQFNVQQ